MKYKGLTAGLLACAVIAGIGGMFPKQSDFQPPELVANAVNVKTYKDWEYIKYGKYVGIYSYKGNAEVVEIPTEIEGLPVGIIEGGAFYGHENLISVTIPDTVTEIRQQAFDGCYELTSIVCPSQLKSIDFWAFYDCTRLMYIIIPNTVTTINDDAFRGCPSLEDVYYTGTEEQWNAMKKNSDWHWNPLEDATIHFNYVAPAEISVSSLIDLNKTLKTQQGASLKYDLSGDGIVNVIDLALMKRALLSK